MKFETSKNTNKHKNTKTTQKKTQNKHKNTAIVNCMYFDEFHKFEFSEIHEFSEFCEIKSI